MADKEIKLKFEVDASQAKSELDALTKQASDMGTGAAPSAATPSQGLQGADMQQNANVAALWVASLEEVRAALQQTADVLSLANKDLQENASQTEAVATAQTACATTSKALGNAIELLGGQFYEVNSQFNKGGGVFENFQELPILFQEVMDSLQKLNTLVGQGGWENVAASIKSAAEAYKELGANLGSVGTGMKEVNAAVKDTDLTSLHALLKELLDVTKQNATANKERAQSEKEVTTATREKREADTEAEGAQRLLLMSVTELRAEYARLAAEIKKAAAAGDSAKVAALQQQQAAVARQIRATSKEVNLNRLALFGQAQAAGQVANALSSLGSDMANFGENAKNGTLDLTSMVGALGSLTSALQAGLGPIGWAMLAVQGLAMAWNFFAQERKKAEEIERNAQKFQADYRSARIGENMEMLKKERELNEQMYKERIAGYYKAARERQKIDDEEKDRNAAIANKEAQDEKAAADEVARHRRALIQAEMQNASDERKKELQEELLNIDMEQRARDVSAKERQAKEAKEIAERTKTNVEELEKNLRNNKELQDFLTIKLPDVDKWHALNKEIAETSNKLGGRTNETLEKLSTERREIEDDLIEQVKKIKTDFKGGFEEALELYNTMKETGEVQKNDLAELKKKQTADAAAAAEADRALSLAKEKADNENEEARLSKDAAAQKKAAQDAEKEREKEKRRIESELNEKLRAILDDTKTTGNYTVEDNRTKREILQEDSKLLRQRESELLALQMNQNLTDAQKKQIAQELENVRSQTRGLAQAQANNAAESRKWLKELRPPKLTAANKLAQYNLNNLSKAYARQAKMAERAAASGNDKAAERWQRQLQRTANAMGRVSGKSEQADKLYKETVDKLQAVRSNSADTAKATAQTAQKAKREADTGLKTAQKANETIVTSQEVQNATTTIEQKQGELTTALATVNGGMNTLGAALNNLMAQVLNMSTLISAMMDSTSTGLKNIDRVLQKHSNELNRLNNVVSSLTSIR